MKSSDSEGPQVSKVTEFQAWLEDPIPEEFLNYAETTGREENSVNDVLLYSADDGRTPKKVQGQAFLRSANLQSFFQVRTYDLTA
jgi:hypothetical protein